MRVTPAAMGDAVYAAAGDGSLVAIALDDGHAFWQTRLWASALTDLVLGHAAFLAGADDGSVCRFDVPPAMPLTASAPATA